MLNSYQLVTFIEITKKEEGYGSRTATALIFFAGGKVTPPDLLVFKA